MIPLFYELIRYIYLPRKIHDLSEKINFILDRLATVIFGLVDEHKVMPAYNLTKDDLINLCGGWPSEQIRSFTCFIKSVSAEALHINIETDLYKVERRINFESGLISNILMDVFEPGKGIGTRLFCNQVKEARRMGFRKMTTMAVNPDGITDWVGYYCWARLGYQMHPSDHEEFMEMMHYLHRPETNIQELLETASGREIWIRDGFTWLGEFYLHDTSQNLIYLKTYLLEKNKDYDL
jgi:hypothetical protein